MAGWIRFAVTIGSGLGYWFQRKFAWPYDLVMRLLNDEFARVARVAGRKRMP